MRLILFGFALLLFASLSTIYLLQPSLSPSPTPRPTTRLPKADYQRLAAKLRSQVQSQDPSVAQAELTTQMDQDPRVLRSCHGLAHEIGHAAIDKYKNLPQSLHFANDVCGSGYLHGALERYMKDLPDIESVLTTICPAGDSRCEHGLGHGFMFYTTNNLPQSLDWCSHLPATNSQTRCSEGVFMENFATDQKLHPSLYLNPQEPTYICKEQSNIAYQAVCYFYAPIYYLENHQDDYQSALSWCRSLPAHTQSCTRGVGSRLLKDNIKNIPYVESVCAQNPDQTKDCFSGALSYFETNFTSVPRSSFCAQISPILRPTCESLL